jgi:predicted ATPase
MSTETPNEHSSRRNARVFLKKFRIRNYKSIGKCEAALSPLTVLVGRNGAGKSNFLDALRFIVDGLQTSVDHALKFRGGIDAVRRRSTGHPRNFTLQLELQLPKWQLATYGFEIAARPKGGFVVSQEELSIQSEDARAVAGYRIESGKLIHSSSQQMPPASPDRLYLVNAAGLPAFRGVYDGLLSMGFYNLNPEVMKELQAPDAGELLHRDGGNIASVIARLAADKPRVKERIRSYLSTIVPGITDVDRVALGPRETLEFRQEVVGSAHPWKFYATSISDGTLRALGTLVAVTQLAERKKHVTLVGIEEPETALHPAASGALMDALREAATQTQVLVTSHSPDLLDQASSESDGLLVVVSRQGNTDIAPIDRASRKAISRHLYTPGEMLRMNQLEPDEEDVIRQKRLPLFGTDEDS